MKQTYIRISEKIWITLRPDMLTAIWIFAHLHHFTFDSNSCERAIRIHSSIRQFDFSKLHRRTKKLHFIIIYWWRCVCVELRQNCSWRLRWCISTATILEIPHREGELWFYSCARCLRFVCTDSFFLHLLLYFFQIRRDLRLPRRWNNSGTNFLGVFPFWIKITKW